MRYADALAGELSLVSKGDLGHRRGHAVDQLVENFTRQAPLLNDEAVELYDVALRWLVADLEKEALVQLAEKLADIPNAPYGTIRILAFHDEIAVAAPVLERSSRLEAGDLIAIIGAKGQQHIMLVAKRSDLTEAVTDRLIAVGSAPVLQTLAANGRAPLSRDGSAILLTRANADRKLAVALADRFGLPPQLRDRLVEDAASVLRAHLAKMLRKSSPAELDAAVAASIEASAARIGAAPPSHDAANRIARLEQKPDLSHEHLFLDLLRHRRLRESLQILAERAGLPHDLVLTIFAGDDFELMAVVLRAADMSWAAAEETLAARSGGLDRLALREMLRNRFTMMSQRDAARLARNAKIARPAAQAAS
ncbi:DUF2336 domain-containing protein [Terrarubrum flagellatum]|uniref:DUF2336 domain-containing protein n=1 Tax=Terrirubrum flagellatum TaxID=2895980 RepID=UPI003144D755